MKKEKEEASKGMAKIKRCSRCGNDFLKGKHCLHFPYEKKYICLCHVCLNGFLFSFYQDFIGKMRELKEHE